MEERDDRRQPAKWKSVRKELMERAKKDSMGNNVVSEEEIKLCEDPKFLLLHQHLSPGLADGPTEWHTWCAIWKTGGKYRFPRDMQHLIQILEFSGQTRRDKNIKANWYLMQEKNLVLSGKHPVPKRDLSFIPVAEEPEDPIAKMLKNVRMGTPLLGLDKECKRKFAASQEIFDQRMEYNKQYRKMFPSKDGKKQYSVRIYANRENKTAYFAPKHVAGLREVSKDHKWVQEGLGIKLEYEYDESLGFSIWAVPRNMDTMTGGDQAQIDETLRLLENAHHFLRFWVYELNMQRKHKLPSLSECYSDFKAAGTSAKYMSFAQKNKIPLKPRPMNRVEQYEAGELRPGDEGYPRQVYSEKLNLQTGEIEEIDTSNIDPDTLEEKKPSRKPEPPLGNWADHVHEELGSVDSTANRFQVLTLSSDAEEEQVGEQATEKSNVTPPEQSEEVTKGKDE